jgi:hypothetical protein
MAAAATFSPDAKTGYFRFGVTGCNERLRKRAQRSKLVRDGLIYSPADENLAAFSSARGLHGPPKYGNPKSCPMLIRAV